MRQTREAITQNLAERLCWEAARRDDTRIARRRYRKQVIDGVYRLDEGAVLDAFFHFLEELGVSERMAQVRGTAIARAMVPCVQYILLDGVKTLLGIESMNALPALLFSDEALMRLVGFNAHQVQHGVCQRGAAKRQGPRTAGPICPEALAHNLVKLHLRDLEALFNGSIQALAQAGRLGTTVTGILDATDLETTQHYAGCGQVTRKQKVTDKWGKVHQIEVTVYGWKVLVLIEVRTKIPLAVKVVKIHEHEGLWMRALVIQAQANLAGATPLDKLVFDKGFWDGTDLWRLDQRGITFVVPAKDNMAVTADARTQAAAGEEITMGHRVHTARHGQGKTAWTERRETEVVGITGLTTSDQDGTPEHGRHHNRRDFPPHPIKAVVVRKWNGRDYGPGGKTVFLPNAAVTKPLQPFDADDGRSLLEHCCIKEAKQQWDLGHPPQKNERAVRVHVVFTLLMFALATAYRWQGEQAVLGEEPVGWRRQLLQQTREKVIVFAQHCYGIFPVAEYSLLLGVTLKKLPPGIGTYQEVLAKYGLAGHS
jgi:Transposase DDE domain